VVVARSLASGRFYAFFPSGRGHTFFGRLLGFFAGRSDRRKRRLARPALVVVVASFGGLLRRCGGENFEAAR